MMNWGRVFIAPSTFESNTEKSILVHELIHLHICQHLGIFKFAGGIPAWFNEGLAVMISGGAGAEEYSDSAAISWINNDKCFTPTKNGNVIKTSGRNDSQLPWDMFYRQTSLFVKFLYESNPDAFQLLLKDIENGNKFENAFELNYRNNIQEAFDTFKKSMADL
jgi:hypothetical protein